MGSLQRKRRTTGKKALAYRGKGGKTTDTAFLALGLRVVLYLLMFVCLSVGLFVCLFACERAKLSALSANVVADVC